VHYYQFNIGDYASHTRHLTPIEDICYRRLLDYYYLHEKPLKNDSAYLSRVLLLSDYKSELESVLNEFFELSSDGWINTRALKEITQYQKFIEDGKRGAAKRWGKGDYSPPKQSLIANNNHKPLNNNHSAAHLKMSDKTLMDLASIHKLSTVGLSKEQIVEKINKVAGIK
jgi:uncharacterized protein YdaU (DUF1376 family)